MQKALQTLATAFVASAGLVTGMPVHAQGMTANLGAMGQPSPQQRAYQDQTRRNDRAGYSIEHSQNNNNYRSSGSYGSTSGQSFYNADGVVVARCLSTPVSAAVVTLRRLEDGNDLVVIIPKSSVRPVQAREYGGNLVTRSVAFELNVDQRYYDALSEAMSQQQGYSLGQGPASRWFEKASANFQVPFLARQDPYGVLLTQASYRLPASEHQLNQALGNIPARAGNSAGRPANASAASCFGYGYR